MRVLKSMRALAAHVLWSAAGNAVPALGPAPSSAPHQPPPAPPPQPIAFFCYERDFAGRWCPVIYFDEVPKAKRGQEDNRTSAWPIEEDDVVAGRLDVDRLMVKHPAPPIPEDME